MSSTKKRMQNREAKTPVVVQKEEMPVIAWDELSIMDLLEISMKDEEAGQIQVLQYKMTQGSATEEDMAQFKQLLSPEYQYGFIEYKAEVMAKYVISVPISWFTKSAQGKSLDFDDPETYKLLQHRRFKQVAGMLTQSDEQAVAISGN